MADLLTYWFAYASIYNNKNKATKKHKLLKQYNKKYKLQKQKCALLKQQQTENITHFANISKK